METVREKKYEKNPTDTNWKNLKLTELLHGTPREQIGKQVQQIQMSICSLASICFHKLLFISNQMYNVKMHLLGSELFL